MDGMNQHAGIGGGFYSFCLDKNSPTQTFTEQIGDHSFGNPFLFEPATQVPLSQFTTTHPHAIQYTTAHIPPTQHFTTPAPPNDQSATRRPVTWTAQGTFPWRAYQLPSQDTNPPPTTIPSPIRLPATINRYPPIEAGPGTMMSTLVCAYPSTFAPSSFTLHNTTLLRRNEWLYKPSLYTLVPREHWRVAESLITEAKQLAPCLVEEGYITVRDTVQIVHHCVRPLVPVSEWELMGFVLWATRGLARGEGIDHVRVVLELSGYGKWLGQGDEGEAGDMGHWEMW